MKVLYLINFAGKAGIEKYVENLARLLPVEGVKPYFAYNIPGELSQRMAAMGVPSRRLKLDWPHALPAAAELARLCRRHGIEVIHAQGPRENIIALLAKKRYPALRVVYTEHFTRLCGPAWRQLYRHFTPGNHRVLAVCQESRDVLIANGCPAEKIRVVYNGIEPAAAPRRSMAFRRELGLDDGTFLISCLARFKPEKGLDFLMDALGRLAKETDRPFCCAVAGDGPLMDEIRGRADALGLGDRVRLLGYRTDTAELLAASDLYVCSSKCNEALSFAILEAMNTGLPLVVTDVGGNRDLAELGGIVCGKVLPYGDAAGFAGAIRELMEDGALRASYAENALRKVEQRFNLNKLALEVLDSYSCK